MDFRVSFRRNSPNPRGILRSKSNNLYLKEFCLQFQLLNKIVRLDHYFFIAAGEPPLCMSCSIPLAIRQALNSARADAGNNDLWYQIGKLAIFFKCLWY